MSPETDQGRLEQLEETVNQLRDEVNSLKARLDRISSD
jgi:ubiquinone biosynthesis protein UbiJ